MGDGHIKYAYVRIDTRLLHGQVATAWTKQVNPDRILVVSDGVSHDDLRKNMIIQAAPPHRTEAASSTHSNARAHFFTAQPSSPAREGITSTEVGMGRGPPEVLHTFRYFPRKYISLEAPPSRFPASTQP